MRQTTKQFFSILVWALSVCCVLWGAQVSAAKEVKPAATPLAHEVVEAVTQDMMAIIKTGKEALASDPQAYFDRIQKTLEPNVAFDFIARGVMASYWQTATEAQRDAFKDTFTKSMVRTLGKGMANYTDFEIVTLKPDDPNPTARRVTVVQEVKGGDQVNRVSYTMQRRSVSSEWKVTNVTLNGVNLGMSFRDQFVQGVKQHGGDISKAIANWLKTDEEKA